jgi:hypothetical protein
MLAGGELREAAPTAVDYQVVLRGSKGAVPELTTEELYARACEIGWAEACADGG